LNVLIFASKITGQFASVEGGQFNRFTHLSIIRVSVETVKIVKGLPALKEEVKIVEGK